MNKTQVIKELLRSRNLTMKEIASAAGVTRARVHQVATEMGLETSSWAADIRVRRAKPAIKSLWDSGMGTYEIASKVGISELVVRTALQEDGVEWEEFQRRKFERQSNAQKGLNRGFGHKLTAKQACEIRELLSRPIRERDYTWNDLARRYGVTTGMLCQIRTGRAWFDHPAPATEWHERRALA